jgi:hypothetical protein
VHSQRLRARQATRIDSDSRANRWERLQTQEKQNVPHQKHLGAIPKFDYRHRIGQIGVSHQFTSSLVQPPLILWTYLQKSCHRLPFTSHRFTAEEPDTHRSSYLGTTRAALLGRRRSLYPAGFCPAALPAGSTSRLCPAARPPT